MSTQLLACVDPVLRIAGFRAWLAALAQPRACCVFVDVSEPCTGALERVQPMTFYGDEPEHFVACSSHAQHYREFWTEQWAEYHVGCM